MALPNDLRSLFAELPQARAERNARVEQEARDREDAERRQQEERKSQRQALRSELLVAWDWLLGDGQELAAEMRRAGFGRMELLGPLDEEGRDCPTGAGLHRSGGRRPRDLKMKKADGDEPHRPSAASTEP